MRIELPSPSWADTVLRADDDAHTLTMAAQPAGDWLAGAWQADAALALRIEVAATAPVSMTLTL